MATPVRYPSGVTNVKPGDAAANMPMPSFTRMQYYFDDFNYFLEDDKYISTTLAGNTIDLIDGAGGQLRMAITAVTDDYATLTQLKEHWTIESGKRMWMGFRVALSEAVTYTSFGFGLAQVGTDYVGTTPAEGLYFRKDGADTNMDITLNSGGAAVASATGIDTVVAATFATYEVEFDGTSAFKYFVDGVHVGTLTSTGFPTTELSLFIYSEAASATANSSAANFDIDWIYAAKERTSVND